MQDCFLSYGTYTLTNISAVCDKYFSNFKGPTSETQKKAEWYFMMVKKVFFISSCLIHFTCFFYEQFIYAYLLPFPLCNSITYIISYLTSVDHHWKAFCPPVKLSV